MCKMYWILQLQLVSALMKILSRPNHVECLYLVVSARFYYQSQVSTKHIISSLFLYCLILSICYGFGLLFPFCMHGCEMFSGYRYESFNEFLTWILLFTSSLKWNAVKRTLLSSNQFRLSAWPKVESGIIFWSAMEFILT